MHTGIVRKIDELGRIVLPKELRKSLNINSGDDFQISINENKIILEKYSKLESFEDKINDIINCFVSVTNYKIYFVINNKIINSNEIIKENIIKLIQERKVYISDKVLKNQISDNINEEGRMVIYPIVLNSDLLGSLILISNDNINNIVSNSKILNNLIKNIVSRE